MAELTENLLRLKQVPEVGALLLWRLIRRFGGSDKIFGASVTDLASVNGMNRTKAENVLAAAALDPRREMEQALDAGVNIIPYDDPEYPKPLLHSFDPPVVLYVLGRIRPEDQVAVGIVGTRHASSYGREQAVTLAGACARAGYTVVSGLARGIDTYAHQGALDAGGRTIGVLGCGFDHIYPEENRDLALEMAASGAVVSEFPMAMKPSRTSFPARNRIIAAMSLGLLVVEAPLRSGSLITARLANEIGRSVFAVPGRVGDAASEGCNKLIADGAVMVTKADDILNELNPASGVPALPEKRRADKAAKADDGPLFSPRSGSAASEPAEQRQPETSPLRPSRWTKAKPRTKNETSAKELHNEADDAALSRQEQPAAPRPSLTKEQAAILDVVKAEWQSVDDITEASGLPARQVVAALAMLKLRRLVEQGPGQTYRLSRTP